MKRLNCDDLRALAPELVLGSLDGAQRVEALNHLTGCQDCRSTVDELSRTADALLLIGPEAEPPAGFEQMTLSRLATERRRSVRRWRPLVAAAAALAVVALGLGVYAGRATAPESALRRATFTGANGAQVGQVYLHQDGDSSWCYVELAGPPYDSVYDVRATLRDGRIVVVERFSAVRGRGSYGRSLEVPADDIVSMTIESTDGRWRYQATLPT